MTFADNLWFFPLVGNGYQIFRIVEFLEETLSLIAEHFPIFTYMYIVYVFKSDHKRGEHNS
jgi:hypothetical protein